MARDLALLTNDLQAPAVSIAPVIGEVLAAIAALPACLLARMSGSGATCFGLFPTSAEARDAAASINHPGWWVWGGGLYEPAPGDI
jgi:4-diphosphocytidyl-2-C-methyl-D-erythritol kinase